jgi:Mpv17 / PMP22 family
MKTATTMAIKVLARTTKRTSNSPRLHLLLLISLGVLYVPPFKAVPALLIALLTAYDNFLNRYPLVTKSITAATVIFYGDLLAQRVEAYWFGPKSVKQARIQQQQKFRPDFHRACTLAVEGLFISGPLLHYAYDWMNTHVAAFYGPDATLLQRTMETLVQVAIDIFVFDSVCTLTLMLTSAVLQRRTCQQIITELRTELVPAIYVSWLSAGGMAPLQFLNFGIVPVQFRVLVTNFQDIIWSATVSYMAHRSRH